MINIWLELHSWLFIAEEGPTKAHCVADKAEHGLDHAVGMLGALRRRLRVLTLDLICAFDASGYLLDLGTAEYALHIGYDHFASKILGAYLVLAIVLTAEVKPRSALNCRRRISQWVKKLKPVQIPGLTSQQQDGADKKDWWELGWWHFR